jgi:pimeloyl-ACP methyl ester carboxylesterase
MARIVQITGHGGLRLSCLDTGPRHTRTLPLERRGSVLLLHGLMATARSWRHEISWLAGSTRVLALDQRGHGLSGVPHDGDWSRDAFVGDAAAAIEQAGAAPAVVIGHSMGALNAWCLAAIRPDLVAALVVVDFAPAAPRIQGEWIAWTATWPATFRSLAEVRTFFGEDGRYFTGCVARDGTGYRLIVPAERALAIRAEWDERDHWAEFEAVRCPVLIVGGAESLAPAAAAEMCARQPRARYVQVAGAGHVVHADAPARFREVVEPFVRAHLPDGSA